MHDVSAPHCSYCQHFEACFQTDLVIEWGYCSIKKVPLPEDLARVKSQAESGDYEELLARGGDFGLYVPTVTDCPKFEDLYPF